MGMVGCYKRIGQNELNQILLDTSYLEDMLLKDEEECYDDSVFDVDKAWHGIHYLLNKRIWKGKKPLFNVVLGGTELDFEFGYGNVRYLTVKEVSEVSEVLNKLNLEQLKKNYNPKKFTRKKIYPDIWDNDISFEYLLGNLEGLINFYQKATTNNEAVILFIG
jgi:Domain of unknown function (DUF1877)